jgi:hypothetical protein
VAGQLTLEGMNVTKVLPDKRRRIRKRSHRKSDDISLRDFELQKNQSK